MSKLDELIQSLCPDGVDYKLLGDTVKILDYQRRPVTKADRLAGLYPYYGANGIQDYVDDYIFDGTFLLIGEDGSVINTDNSPVLTWASGKIWVNNHAHVLAEIPEIASLRFVFYYLQTIDVSKIVRGVPPKINQENLRQIRLPLPPLEVQKEIVRILDKFTILEAELEAELEARLLQYDYYRRDLLQLGNPDSVSENTYITLDSVAHFSNTRIEARFVDNSTYVGVDNLLQNKQGKVSSNFVPTSGNLTKFVPGDVLIGNIRPYLQKIWFADVTGGTNGDVLCVRIKIDSVTKILPKYLYQVLASNEFFSYDMQHSKGTKMPRGDKPSIMKFEFFLPPIPDQEKIVSILDHFEAIVNDLKNGLPAEIAARHKQYEYYRDQLLTFKEKAA